MTKLWGGRFTKDLNTTAEKLSYSYSFDWRLAKYDLKTNLAYAKALAQKGVMTESEILALEKFFVTILPKLEAQDPEILGRDEDIHSCVERLTTQALGETGKKMHTGKSRNDQVITDVRLYMKEEIAHVTVLMEDVLRVINKQASQHLETIFPGFTHFQLAQPVLLAHHLLAYFEMFYRDRKRMTETLERVDICPLGSGALAGNSYDLDRSFIAQELGFSKISRNSMDAVADRDFILEFISAAAITMMHLSRFCEELVLWSSPLLGFIQIGDEFTTGSSLMPQKKNPDMAELIRGKSGRIIGHYTGLHQVLKALPLTYNRDLQEDKEALFDTVDTLKLCLQCFAEMLDTVVFNKNAIQLALRKGYILATDLADYLVAKGVPFRDAHALTGQIVLYAVEHQKFLEQLTLAEMQQFCAKIEADVAKVFDLAVAVERKDVFGGTARKRVQYQLRRIAEEFKWNEL